MDVQRWEDGSWWRHSQYIMVLFLELLNLYQWCFVFFKWRKLGLEFSPNVIFIIWMFIDDSKRFILNGCWWKLYQFIIVFSLEIYQFFFSFFENLIWWINLGLGFSIKVIFRRWMFRGCVLMRTCLVFILGIFSAASEFFLSLKSLSSVSRDTFSLLADESIMILCCLSWYVSLNCWIYSSCCLLLLSHFSWNTFSSLDKESITIFWCLSNQYFVLFVVIYFSQLLKFLFLFFTSFIPLLFKILQFNG